jgi:ribosomal protein S18 acetylase RimI-like enzyme
VSEGEGEEEGSTTAMEIVRLKPNWEVPLLDFLTLLARTGDDKFFHPHPSTIEAIKRCSAETTADCYYVLKADATVLGYGMLRGWDEGYDIPSLGIAVHPKIRGKGWGSAFMHFLHATARTKGAKKVRLTVHRSNTVALRMYKTLGYYFDDLDAYRLVGFLDLLGG